MLPEFSANANMTPSVVSSRHTLPFFTTDFNVKDGNIRTGAFIFSVGRVRSSATPSIISCLVISCLYNVPAIESNKYA